MPFGYLLLIIKVLRYFSSKMKKKKFKAEIEINISDNTIQKHLIHLLELFPLKKKKIEQKSRYYLSIFSSLYKSICILQKCI